MGFAQEHSMTAQAGSEANSDMAARLLAAAPRSFRLQNPTGHEEIAASPARFGVLRLDAPTAQEVTD